MERGRGRGRCQGQVFWPRGLGLNEDLTKIIERAIEARYIIFGLNTADLRSVEFIVKRVMIKLFCTYDNTVISSCMSFFGSSSVTEFTD